LTPERNRDSIRRRDGPGAGVPARVHRAEARKEVTVKEKPVSTLDLEVEEIESRERAFGNCTSSTTSSHCTCACFITTNSQL